MRPCASATSIEDATMRLTSFTDFGLRALMRLAGDPARAFTTDEIAREFGISRNHLAKVIRELAAAGVVATQRGTGGGFRLARPAEEVTLGEIVRLLEARSALVECFRRDGGACVLTPGCRLKGRLDAAREAFLRELDGTTLAECPWPSAGNAPLAPIVA
jgi:Rrf2 family transcriptional regulator, nitric oxide-sensitive transcriptional repressor